MVHLVAPLKYYEESPPAHTARRINAAPSSIQGLVYVTTNMLTLILPSFHQLPLLIKRAVQLGHTGAATSSLPILPRIEQ
jgi:hypothetical protein